MSYTSLNFAYFVAIVAAVYFLFPVKKYQWTVLLAASYVFYLFAGFKYAAFLVITTATTYASALVIDSIAIKAKAELKAQKENWDKAQKKAFKEQTGRKKRLIMVCTVVFNLGILAFVQIFQVADSCTTSTINTIGINITSIFVINYG